VRIAAENMLGMSFCYPCGLSRIFCCDVVNTGEFYPEGEEEEFPEI